MKFQYLQNEFVVWVESLVCFEEDAGWNIFTDLYKY